MAKLSMQQAAYGADPEQSSATPVQFLPSTMLSWRTPIMARSGLPAQAGHKTRFAEALRPQAKLIQPAS